MLGLWVYAIILDFRGIILEQVYKFFFSFPFFDFVLELVYYMTQARSSRLSLPNKWDYGYVQMCLAYEKPLSEKIKYYYSL